MGNGWKRSDNTRRRYLRKGKRNEEYTSYARTIVEEYKKEVLEKVNTLTLYSPTTTIDLSSCPHSIVERLLNKDGSNFIVGTNFTSITITFE